MAGRRGLAKALPTFNWKKLLPNPIIGVDEVGRGCLFGRVYAAAVILKSTKDLRHYKDSKLLSASRRESLFESILTHHQGSIAFAEVEEIDSLNILWASMLAMKRAVEGLGVNHGHVLVDGNRKIPNLLEDFVQTTVIKGDLRAKPIGAASILAKVARDRYVCEQATKFPGYGLESHKGYATSEHVDALIRLGPTSLHRRAFSGVKEHWGQFKLELEKIESQQLKGSNAQQIQQKSKLVANQGTKGRSTGARALPKT